MTLEDIVVKNPYETINEYIHRLGLQRYNLNISWSDLADYVEQEFNVSLTSEAVRNRYRRTLQNPDYATENIEQKIEDKSKVFQLQQERLAINNAYRRLSREETIKEIGIESAKIISSNGKSFEISPFKNYQTHTNEAILLIGDWHYGMQITSPFNEYNTEIAKRRVNELYQKTVEHLIFHSINKLHVINLGDMISGIIHLPLRLQSQSDVITQIIEVSELVANLLYSLSEYAEINYYSTLDNHSRINPNKKDSIQLETLARITPWFLKERFNRNDRVIIHDNYQYTPDVVAFTVQGFNVLAVHGDKDKPQQVIDRMNSFTGKHHDLICLAHYHHFNCNEQNRTMMISNGSLMGTDDYAMDLRLSSNPSQTLIIVSDKDVCECIYKINLS